jgi:hypothetical protein
MSKISDRKKSNSRKKLDTAIVVALIGMVTSWRFMAKKKQEKH